MSTPYSNAKSACAGKTSTLSIEAQNIQSNNNGELGDVLDLVQAASFLRCHPKTLRLQAAAGKVPGKRLGKLWRFYRPTLEAWMREAA